MMRLTDRFYTHFLLIILGGLLSGCSVLGLSPLNDIRSIRIEASADCNRNMPVAIDFVFISDERVAKLLADLNGPDWFGRKQELMMRYDKQINVISAEVVPLSILSALSLPEDHSRSGNILMFANYLGVEGQLVAQLGQYRQLKILLQREGYRLIEMHQG